MVSPSGGVDVSNGSFSIFEDQRESMDFEVGHVIKKVRNPSGGKNPQLGPRISDAKKHGQIEWVF